MAAVIAAYAISAHRLSVSTAAAGFGVVLFAVAPLFAVLVVVAWRSQRIPAVVVVLGAIGALAALWTSSDAVGSHLPFVYLLQGVSADAALAVLFAASLRDGHVPLCSRVAAMVRGTPLHPSVERYTRRLTIAWAAFFGAMVVTSILLFVLAPVGAWSTFANLLAYPLVALMFVGEYFVRRHVLRDVPHTPIDAAFRAFRERGIAPDRMTVPRQ